MYSRLDKSVPVFLFAAASSVLAVARRLKPSPAGYGTHTQLGLPPCNFMRITHLPCPSCGLTTCFAWAVRFQFSKAFSANPFGVLLFFFTALLIPASIFLLWRGISIRRITESATFVRGLYAASALYFISWAIKLATFHLVTQ